MTEGRLTIVDETASGDTINEFLISFDNATVSVKDIIVSRVEKEVLEYNSKLPERFYGLVRPTEAEETLNGYSMKKRKTVDAEKQIQVALEAFEHNGYFVFVNESQVESLDDKVRITPQTKVSFLKLTPLVGG